MKKVILCSCLVAVLLCCLIVPSFAANWFGGSTEVLDCYSFTASASSGTYAVIRVIPYSSSNACTAARDFTIGSYSISAGDVFYGGLVSGGYQALFVNGTQVGTLNSIDTVLYIEESSFTSYGDVVNECTPVYTTVGADGFVTSGFSSGLGIAGTVLNFCASNTYVLIAIGLAVGVPLVGWGISKLKSLIKGY